MQFEYTRRRGAVSPVTDAATFRVNSLRRGALDGTPAIDLTTLIDRSYEYHSPRELRWHLAQRLGVLPAAVTVTENGRAMR